MKKKLVGMLLTAAMVVGLVAGCGSSGGGESSEADSAEDSGTEASEDAGEGVTLTYWGWDSNCYEPMFEAYMASHPDVKIEATAVEWGDMLTKVQQALASGSELPTMFGMDFALIENWKDMDVCEDLTAYGFDKSEYVEILVEKASTEDGKVIGCVENVCPAGIAYKRDLAKEYFGTDDPDELSAMFNSYDAYAEKGAEVYDKSEGKVHLFHSGQAVAEWLYFASDVENQTGDTLNYTDKMTDILSTLIKLRDANAVDSYQNGTAEANATYAGSEHIFFPCPDWAITYYVEANDPDGSGNWGIIKAPVSYSHGGTCLGITKQSTDEQKQAAFDFIKWATQEEEGVNVAKDKAGYITAYTKYTYDPDFIKRADEDFFGGQNISELFYKEIVEEMDIAPASPWDNSITSVRNDLAQQLMDDKSMTLEKALEIGQEQLEQLVTDDSITIK